MTLRLAISIIVLSLLLVVIQGGVLKMALPTWAVPNLFLVVVVFIAFRVPTVGGVLVAFCLGLILDLSTGKLLGPNAGSFAVVCGFLASISQRLYIKSYPAVAVTVFFSSLLSTLLFLVFTYEVRGISGVGLANSLLEGVITAAIGPFLMSLMDRYLPQDRETYGLSRRALGKRL